MGVDEIQLAADLPHTSNRVCEELGGRQLHQIRASLKEGVTEVVVQVGPIDDSRRSLFVETSGDPLGDETLVPAADRGDVQALYIVIDEKVEVLALEPAAHPEIVEADEVTGVNLQEARRERVFQQPFRRHCPHVRRQGFTR